MARAATTSGMPAATSEEKTRTRMSAANGNDTVSAWISSFSDWTAWSSVAGATPVSSSVRARRLVDQRAQLGHLVDRRFVGDRQADDDVRGRAVGADEPVVPGLRPAERAVDAVVGDEPVERAGDRRLELRRAGVRAVLALEDRDDRATARPRTRPASRSRDGDRLGIRVGPAAGAQRAGDLGGEEASRRPRARTARMAMAGGSGRRTLPSGGTSSTGSQLAVGGRSASCAAHHRE